MYPIIIREYICLPTDSPGGRSDYQHGRLGYPKVVHEDTIGYRRETYFILSLTDWARPRLGRLMCCKVKSFVYCINECLERLQFRGPPLLSAMLPARFLAQSSESRLCSNLTMTINLT